MLVPHGGHTMFPAMTPVRIDFGFHFATSEVEDSATAFAAVRW
jgi:hypothetical protein